PQHENARQIDARQRRTHSCSSRRENKGIVWLAINSTRFEFLYLNLATGAVDGCDFILRANFNVKAIPKQCTVRDEQLSLVLDHVADVVWEPAVSEGDIWAAIDHGDCCVFVETPAARGARGDAADDDNAFGCFHGCDCVHERRDP